MTRFKAALFDRIVTSEDIKHSKPASGCQTKQDITRKKAPAFLQVPFPCEDWQI